jgi:hypothetical protein
MHELPHERQRNQEKSSRGDDSMGRACQKNSERNENCTIRYIGYIRDIS